MRIRKLAKELGVHEEVLLGLALELGLGRYADAEQQLGKDAEERLRITVRHRPPETRNAVRTPSFLNRPPVRPVLPGEDVYWDGAMKGVEKLPIKAVTAPVSTRGSGKAPPPPPRKLSTPGTPVLGKATVPPAPSGAVVTPALPPQMDSKKISVEREQIVAEREALRTEISLLQQKVTQLTEQNLLFAGRMARALEDQERLQRSLDTSGAERDSLRDQVTQLERNLGQLEGRPGSVPFRKVLEKRGIIGEDEAAMALEALLSARLGAPLIQLLSTEDPEGLREFLHEKLLLVAEGDDPPPGMVSLRVPAERSEADPASAVKDAMRRFSTACLIHNLRSIVIVGGSPAYHRQLREGLDGRLKLRLVPGDRRGRLAEYPSAEVVILWASSILDHRVSEHYPQGWVIPHRGIARMLAAATERIEGRSG